MMDDTMKDAPAQVRLYITCTGHCTDMCEACGHSRAVHCHPHRFPGQYSTHTNCRSGAARVSGPCAYAFTYHCIALLTSIQGQQRMEYDLTGDASGPESEEGTDVAQVSQVSIFHYHCINPSS